MAALAEVGEALSISIMMRLLCWPFVKEGKASPSVERTLAMTVVLGRAM